MNEQQESRQQRGGREPADAKRGGRDWPCVTVIHPEHGSYEMDVHGLQASNGHIVLAAFLGKDGASGGKRSRRTSIASPTGSASRPSTRPPRMPSSNGSCRPVCGRQNSKRQTGKNRRVAHPAAL